MTYLSLISALLVSLSAQAVARSPGFFSASECGTQSYRNDRITMIDIAEICLGDAVMSPSDRPFPAVQFRMTTGQSILFHVQKIKRLDFRNSDVQKDRYLYELVNTNGERLVMKVLKSRTGRIDSVSGRYGILNFSVVNFDRVD